MANEERRKVSAIKKGTKAWLTWQIIEIILLFAAGIITIVFSAEDGFKNGLLITLGAFLTAGGLLKTVANLWALSKTTDREDLTYGLTLGGVFELALGIAVIVDVAIEGQKIIDTVTSFSVLFIGILGVALATFAIILGLIIAFNKKLRWTAGVVYSFLVGAVIMALSIIVLVYKDESGTFTSLFLIVVGVALILIAAVTLVNVIRVMHTISKAKKASVVVVVEKQEVEKKEIENEKK